MCRGRLLFTVVFCIYLTTILSIRCYTGTDRNCLLTPDTIDCGLSEICQCSKYRFQCSKDDPSCNEQEQMNTRKIWAYAVVSKNRCQSILAFPNIYGEAACCSTNECNRPSTGRCLRSQARRRSIRQKTNILVQVSL